jgi:hypothetical protein
MVSELFTCRTSASARRPPLADPLMRDVAEREFLEREFEESAKDLAIKEIDRLDLTLIKRNLCLPVSRRSKGWSQERAEEAEKWYKRFLKLSVLQDKKVVPPADADEVWHSHLLHSRKYYADCLRIFGAYFHHSPSDGTERGKNRMGDSFQITLSLFGKFFGEQPLEGRNSSGGDCHCNGHCCGNDK